MPVFGDVPPPGKVGEPYTVAHMNKLRALALQAASVSVAGGLGAGGTNMPGITGIRFPSAPRIVAMLTSVSSNHYAWTEQVYQGGAWVNGARTGTTTFDYAIEINNNGPASGSLPYRVFCWRDVASGQWTFAVGSC